MQQQIAPARPHVPRARDVFPPHFAQQHGAQDSHIVMPRQQRHQRDDLDPGFRHLQLFTDGTIQTQIHRLTDSKK